MWMHDIISATTWLVSIVCRFLFKISIMEAKCNKNKTPVLAQHKSLKGKTTPHEPPKSTNSINLSRKFAGANWQKSGVPSISAADSKKNNKDKKFISKYVAMDCEMVGTGPSGQDDMLARVSVVDQNGEVLLDKYVKPTTEVTDYRTNVSGIRPRDIEFGEEFEVVQNEVQNLLRNKILVGHSVTHDLAIISLKHPKKLIRDTAKYRPLAKFVSNGSTPSLKKLSKVILGIDIQSGEHNSVEDARAAMAVYNRLSIDWEKHIRKNALRYSRNGIRRT